MSPGAIPWQWKKAGVSDRVLCESEEENEDDI